MKVTPEHRRVCEAEMALEAMARIRASVSK